MATYNGGRFLQEQLDSLARQTLLPYELVACDDGSTDGTLGILRMFAAKAPFPVRIFENDVRLGHGGNFLQAASLCSGELVAFSDQDDVWLDRKLERSAEAIDETGSVLVIHSGDVVDENLKPTGRRTPSARRRTCLDSYKGGGWRPLGQRLGMSPGFACVFRSSLLGHVPPVWPLMAPDRGHEHWLFFAAEVAGSVTLIPETLVLYRQHGRNTAGYRAGTERGRWAFLGVGCAEYESQAEDAAARARILADALERLPELRQRLLRAREWYAARANSLARRASLYGGAPSMVANARQLFSMAAGGTYRPVSQGGLGLKGLAKDLFMPMLRPNVSGTSHGPVASN